MLAAVSTSIMYWLGTTGRLVTRLTLERGTTPSAKLALRRETRRDQRAMSGERTDFQRIRKVILWWHTAFIPPLTEDIRDHVNMFHTTSKEGRWSNPCIVWGQRVSMDRSIFRRRIKNLFLYSGPRTINVEELSRGHRTLAWRAFLLPERLAIVRVPTETSTLRAFYSWWVRVLRRPCQPG